MMIDDIIKECEASLAPEFDRIDQTAYYNQEKVLAAFQDCKVALRHFSPTTGYGYDDDGRDTLNRVFAAALGAQSAVVSPHIASGTHAISLMLFGILRPGDTLLSVSGLPYDTLCDVIGGEGSGSLKDFGVGFQSVELLQDGGFDYEKIKTALKQKPKMVFVQRSRGYNWRGALKCEDIQSVCSLVKSVSPDSVIAVDNCYGEFVERQEPTQLGADLIAGSLIKNPGGGLAPTGGYIAGRAELVKLVEYRLTAPGVGGEVGSYAYGYRPFYQGLFTAPHVTAQAKKTSALFGAVFSRLGYRTLPAAGEESGDIIRSIRFDTEAELVEFCRAVQYVSPVDSFVTPYPWDMPGYAHKVIMAAGTFVQGASIELSADSPIKEPYIAYIQGSLTYEHGKIAVKKCAESVISTKAE